MDLREDGSFRLNLACFGYTAGLRMTNARFDAVFGAPARPAESRLTQHYMDVARSIQEVTEEILFRMAKQVRRETGLLNLCLAGGVALNCVANGRILREGIFERIWIQPAAGDAGGALGAAFVAWHHALERPRPATGGRDAMQGGYLGPAFGRREIELALSYLGDAERGSFTVRELDEAALPGAVADLLAAGATHIRVFPVFLGVGKHAREDLPALMQALRGAHPAVRFELLPSAGESPALTELLAELALGSR